MMFAFADSPNVSQRTTLPLPLSSFPPQALHPADPPLRNGLSIANPLMVGV